MSTEDTLHQASFVILSRLQSGTEDVVRLDVALAAVAAAVAKERERCAAIAESWATDETATTCANISAAIRGA